MPNSADPLVTIKISGHETLPSWAILLAWPVLAITISVIWSSNIWGYLLLLGFCALIPLIFRTVVAEINLSAKRLRIVRDYFGWHSKVIADCSFEQCEAVGVATNPEGPETFYMKFNGEPRIREFWVVADETPSELADKLSKLIGLVRRDI